MAYCLPPQFANSFLAKLKSGEIDPTKLADMTSSERRKFFEPIVGLDNAEQVNALFESKLLLKDVKRGLVTWAKTVGGITEPTRKDLLAKIGRMPDELLNPVDQNKFLADLAATKLGVTVTAEEAQQIFDLSQRAEAARAAMQARMSLETQIAYGRAANELTEAVEAMKPSTRSMALEILSTTKSTMATLDFSAPLVQGWGAMATPEFWEGLPKMFKYFGNEEALQDLRGYIRGHPKFEQMKQSKLGIVELSDKLSLREEQIQSSLLERANEYLKKKYGVPNVIRASNRAFTGYMNYVRVKGFENLDNALRMAGEEMTPELYRQIANVINDTTGRGAIGKADKYAGFTVLNTVIWTPRKISATLGMMNPWNYLNPSISPAIRRERLKRVLGSIAITSTAVGLANAAGYSVNLNPISTDFMRIKAGDTSFDLSGGNVAYLRLMARLLFNEAITSRGTVIEYGEGYRAPTRADAIIDFVRGRFAPNAAVIADALYGKDPVGRPFSLTAEMSDKLVPMTINNYIDLAYEDPGNMGALILSPLSIFGAGMYVQTDIGANTSRFDALGAPKGTDHTNNPVARTLERVGIQLNMPERNIRGVPLDDRLYDEYAGRAGQAVQRELASVVRTPGFDRLPLGRQEDLLKSHVANAREYARSVMMGKHPEIMREAERLKRERAQQGSKAAQERRAQ